MIPTKEQIELVENWLGGPDRDEEGPEWNIESFRKHMIYSKVMDYQQWYVVGILAEACQKQGIRFQTPMWDVVKKQWYVECGSCKSTIQWEWNDNPAYASVSAVAQHLANKDVAVEIEECTE